MMLQIVEDCSPYYMVLQHDNQDLVIQYALDILNSGDYEFSRQLGGFTHNRIRHHQCLELLELSPLHILNKHLRGDAIASKPYASIFSTSPHTYYRAHKDGTSIRYALNYVLVVDDSKCVTRWWDDRVSLTYESVDMGGRSRELEKFDPTLHVPLASRVFHRGECILFNTDIYHDFDNSDSNNERHVLTLRYSHPPHLMWQAVAGIIKNASSTNT